jgi:hypothetical protein
MADIDMKSLVRLGAEVRLAEQIAEVDAILTAFPELGRTPARTSRPAPEPEAKPVRKRKRSRMTPAQKKAVSLRMKRYWAKRRRKKK